MWQGDPYSKNNLYCKKDRQTIFVDILIPNLQSLQGLTLKQYSAILAQRGCVKHSFVLDCHFIATRCENAAVNEVFQLQRSSSLRQRNCSIVPCGFLGFCWGCQLMAMFHSLTFCCGWSWLLEQFKFNRKDQHYGSVVSGDDSQIQSTKKARQKRHPAIINKAVTLPTSPSMNCHTKITNFCWHARPESSRSKDADQTSQKGSESHGDCTSTVAPTKGFAPLNLRFRFCSRLPTPSSVGGCPSGFLQTREPDPVDKRYATDDEKRHWPTISRSHPPSTH